MIASRATVVWHKTRLYKLLREKVRTNRERMGTKGIRGGLCTTHTHTQNVTKRIRAVVVVLFSLLYPHVVVFCVDCCEGPGLYF